MNANTLARLAAVSTLIAPSESLPRDVFEATKTHQGKLEAIKNFNNCIVEKVEGGWASISATPFAAKGIAHKLALEVYAVVDGKWIVRLGRSGTEIIG